MRRILAIILLGFSCAAVAQTTAITATTLVGGDLSPIASGRISFQPTDMNGVPLIVNLGITHGLMLPRTAMCLISNGAITTSLNGSACKVVDTSVTNAGHFCYVVIIQDTVTKWTAPAMPCVQPSGTTWSFDTYVPPAGPTALVVAGIAGPQGPPGATGATGSTGATGPANSLAIGTVSTLSAGSSATASVTGTAPSQTLSLGIPTGATGATGTAGAAATVTVGTTITGAAGTNATVTNSGTSSAAIFNFTVPQGANGSGSGTVTSFAAPSGSWPSWLVPTVTSSTSAPSLAVAASAIPNSALANQSVTVNGTPCTLGSTCTETPATAANLSGTPALPNGVTASTQTAGDNSTKLATDAFVGTAITNAAYTLPQATTSTLGGVKGDGSTLGVASGVMSCTTATSSQIGCSKPDGTTLTAASGVLSTAATIARASMKFSWIGTLPNSQIFAQVLPDASEVYSVPSGCTNSRAESTIAATASTTLTIYKCTAVGFATCSSVGTIVFSAAGKTGAFTCSSAFTLTGSSSQSLYIQGPGTADTTLANLSVALYATHN